MTTMIEAGLDISPIITHHFDYHATMKRDLKP